MSEQEIRERHEALEAMTSTQSVRVLSELRSQAHKDRGELLGRLEAILGRCEELTAELDALEDYIKDCEEDDAHISERECPSYLFNAAPTRP